MIIKVITRLDFYEPRYKQWLENYFLSEEQIKFTSHPLDAITKCEDEDDRIPIMIFHNDVPAGFFVLHGWNEVQAYSDNERALLLRAYSIDSKYQGKGIAKESLRLLPSFISEHFINKNEIILAVNHKNFVAQHVYTTCGFVDKGIRTMGSKGKLFIMHLNL